jgi:CheY-like chemotaxis protein
MECTVRTYSILVVDDDEGIRDSIEDMLCMSGYGTLKAPDAESALEILEHSPPDLILLDGNLPGMKGEEFTQHLRSGNCELPIIGISAEDRRQAMLDAGVNAFIDKPFDPPTFIDFIDQILDRDD